MYLRAFPLRGVKQNAALCCHHPFGLKCLMHLCFKVWCWDATLIKAVEIVGVLWNHSEISRGSENSVSLFFLFLFCLSHGCSSVHVIMFNCNTENHSDPTTPVEMFQWVWRERAREKTSVLMLIAELKLLFSSSLLLLFFSIEDVKKVTIRKKTDADCYDQVLSCRTGRLERISCC